MLSGVQDCEPSDLCAVQAHATGTSLGDLAEARALRRSLGAAADHLPVFAPKGQLGHLLGAAGAVEAILAPKCRRFGRPGAPQHQFRSP